MTYPRLDLIADNRRLHIIGRRVFPRVQPPEVWQPRRHGGAAVSPGKALAEWVTRTASVYVYLANDAGATVTFSQTQPSDGREGSSSSTTAAAGPRRPASQPVAAEEDAAATEHRALEAKGRQWVKSPLQVPAMHFRIGVF